MLIHPGTQERILAETTLGSGTTSKEGSIQSDSLVATLWVDSIASGELTVSVFTLTDTGKELELFSFPVLTVGSINLLLKKAGVSLQRFRVQATYTGICQYEVYIRAIEGAGESSVRILGSSSFRVEQVDLSTTPVALIPASLEDRQGVIIKNWSLTTNMYIAETSAKATVAGGYPVAPRDNVTVDVQAGVAIWAVAESGTIDVRIGES